MSFINWMVNARQNQANYRLAQQFRHEFPGEPLGYIVKLIEDGKLHEELKY